MIESLNKHRRRNTPIFTAMSYLTLLAGIILFTIGLWHADSLAFSEKGFYIATLILCIVGAILTQKVARDNFKDDAIIAEQERERAIKESTTSSTIKKLNE